MSGLQASIDKMRRDDVGDAAVQAFADAYERLREGTGARLPLVLMNSFSTREPSLEALARYDDVEADVPLDFVQNKVPKLLADELEPVEWPDDPDLEWAPPGHGDLYTALVTSGMLDELLERDYRWAFVSNADNLGAVLEPRILAWMASEEIPFVMEVADRTEADRKGGHIAKRRDGSGLVLREIAQTPDDDHYKLLADFEARFPAGPPSLVACRRLTVEGDVLFGAVVVVRGAVTIEHDGEGQLRIED